jgi:hypothetical protein
MTVDFNPVCTDETRYRFGGLEGSFLNSATAIGIGAG